MRTNKKSVLYKLVTVILCFALIQPICTQATEVDTPMPVASHYLTSYQTYVYPAGGGEVQVWFDVTADNYMDELGALTIWLYESTDNSDWNHVETFHYTENSDMLAYDDYFHMGHVTYQGVRNRYYKAYVCIWAGKDGDGDTRYLWTSSKKAI